MTAHPSPDGDVEELSKLVTIRAGFFQVARAADESSIMKDTASSRLRKYQEMGVPLRNS